MADAVRIGWRFLISERRAMVMTLGGIVLGIGLFIVTQAQTSGFERLFVGTVLGVNGAVRIEDRFQAVTGSVEAGDGSGFFVESRESRRYSAGIESPQLVRDALARFGSVTGVSEVLHGAVRAQSAVREDDARVFGIRLADHLAVSDLAAQITRGSLADFEASSQSVVLGATLARRLLLLPGDTVRLEYRGDVRPYRVAAIFETGVTEIDRVRIYAHLGEVRSLLQRPHGASYLQVGLRDPARAREEAARMEEALQHHASSWQERERTWLEVFRALRISSALTVAAILAIAGLGMFNTLAMQVLRKTREIAILRSTGYTRGDIARIFLAQGVIVLVLGSAGGVAVGAGLTWAVSRVPVNIRGIFAADHFVVNWDPWHYAAAVAASSVVVMLAAYAPARRAARLEPADVVRGAG